jgi:Zn-dependent protease
MDATKLIDGLTMYLGFVVLLTFHEFGHAWMALKCGDHTAKDEGRVSLNPLVHIDPLGTVLVPMIALFMTIAGPGGAGFFIGWAKPVPVNPNNLRNQKLDDILITLAGPWMNVLLAVLLVGLARVAQGAQLLEMYQVCNQMATLSLFLCFFNLLPIPPLDGSHVVRCLLGISYESYFAFARYGILILIVVIQIPHIQFLLAELTYGSWGIIARWFGVI